MDEKITIEGSLRIKEILKERNLKMKVLAEQIGITPESLTRALQGNPQYSTLKKIADYLGVSVRDLFKEENIKTSDVDIRGCMFFNGEMIAFNNRQDLDVLLINKDLFSKDICKNRITEFLNVSINESKDNAMMIRYGIDRVLTLSYDSNSCSFSLTQFIVNGEVKFKIFNTIEYCTGDSFSVEEMDLLSESIFLEIKS